MKTRLRILRKGIQVMQKATCLADGFLNENKIAVSPQIDQSPGSNPLTVNGQLLRGTHPFNRTIANISAIESQYKFFILTPFSLLVRFVQ